MQTGQTVVAALKWMLTARFAGQLITWVITILVIRILSPEDYGLMALAMAIVGYLSLFEEIGLGSAIVQRTQLDRRLLEQIFGLLLTLDVVLYGGVWVGAPLAADFFAVPELAPIMRAAGLLLLINAFGTLPDAILNRRMDFRRKSIALFGSMVAGSLLTLVLALQGRGVWALVSGSLFMAVVRVLMLQAFARVWYRPRFGISAVGGAARFGGFITLDRVLTYVYSQSDAPIIGKLLGDAFLGLYSVGMHLASLPMQKVAGLLNEVGFAAFARLQSEPEALRGHFLKAVRVLALLAFPVFLGISSVAPEIVGIFLGDKWAGAVLPIQVLSLVMPVRLLNLVLSSSLCGIGRAGVSARNNLVACIIMPVAFAIGAQWGLQGVCIAWVIAYPLCFVVALIRGLPVIGVGVGEFLAAVRAPALAALLMYLAVSTLRRMLAGLDLPAPGILLSLVLLGVVLYALLALTLQRQTCIDLVSLVWSEEASARVASVDPLAPIKAAVPRLVKLALKERWRARVLHRACHALAESDPRVRVDRRLLERLHYGWGNAGWTADVELLQALCDLVQSGPRHVLECGSGLTTLLMAAVGRAHGVRIWSLEHVDAWRERVQAALDRAGLDNATVCRAPLRSFGAFNWYDVSGLDLPREFDLVVCDGPPAATPGGRYGLLPVMRERLAPRCVIVLDDVNREHERTMLDRWQRESPLSVDVASRTFAVCRMA